MSQLEDIRTWIDGACGDGATRLEMRSVADGEHVRSWPLRNAANDGAERSVTKLAEQVLATATRDGAAQPVARVTYLVLAFGPDDGRHLDRLFITVDGRSSKGLRAGDEMEPANNVGLMSQLMRQNAEMHRLLISAQEGRAEADARMIARLLERLEKHEDKRALMLETWEQLATMQVEREKARHEMALSDERQKYLAGKLDMLLPVLLGRFISGGRPKGTPFFGEELVRQLLGSMKPAQIEALMQGGATKWDPEQLMVFAELYSAYGEREKKLEEKTSNGVAGAASAVDGDTTKGRRPS
jgi:hypothetical protein